MGEDSLCFGRFRLCTVRRELLRDGQPVDVGQRGVALLLALLRAAGQPVSKTRLMQAAWGGRTMEASNLTVQMAALRRQLGDDTLIRTVPSHGYLFAAEVVHGGSPHPPAAPARPEAGWAEPLTRFIGRERERTALAELLGSHRLVTLTGIGGVGKTRLTLQLLRELAAARRGEAVFVDLAPVSESRQVEEIVAAALGAGAGRGVQDALAAALQNRRLLLVLDNAEHLRSAVSRLAMLILGRCAGTSVLVTSRESLGIPGEFVFRLSPLTLPPGSERLTAAEASGSEAVRLLADRAAALLPGFTVTDENAADLAAICRRLDGIALALEMAVPRLEVLTPGQLAARMQDRFKAVAPSRHDVQPRQRTLRAMFDWSWELLSRAERTTLQLLAIAPAGMTLDMLEAAAGAATDPAMAGDVLDHMARLAQNSLLVTHEAEQGRQAGTRYRLLETTRQYAMDRMDPQTRARLDRAHAVRIAALFEGAEQEWPTLHGAAWLARYGSDVDNLRSALHWAFRAEGESELAARLAAASFPLWWELPGLPLREGRRWYDLALAAAGPGTPPATRARLLLGRSWTDTVDGDAANYAAAAEAVCLFRQAGDRTGLAASLWRAAGTVLTCPHVPSALDLLDEAAALFEDGVATKWAALCLTLRGDLLQLAGDPVGALAHYEQSILMAGALGHHYGLMAAGGNRSFLLYSLGRHEEAVDALTALHDEMPPGLRHPVASLLGVTLVALGRYGEAWPMLHEAITRTVSLGMVATLARSVEALALVLADGGDLMAAARFFGFALRLHPPDRRRFGPRVTVFERTTELLSRRLPGRERERLFAEGAGWDEAEVVATAAAVFGPQRSVA